MNKGLSGDLSDILSVNMTAILRVELAFNNLSGEIPGKNFDRYEVIGETATLLSKRKRS